MAFTQSFVFHVRQVDSLETVNCIPKHASRLNSKPSRRSSQINTLTMFFGILRSLELTGLGRNYYRDFDSDKSSTAAPFFFLERQDPSPHGLLNARRAALAHGDQYHNAERRES